MCTPVVVVCEARVGVLRSVCSCRGVRVAIGRWGGSVGPLCVRVLLAVVASAVRGAGGRVGSSAPDRDATTVKPLSLEQKKLLGSI